MLLFFTYVNQNLDIHSYIINIHVLFQEMLSKYFNAKHL